MVDIVTSFVVSHSCTIVTVHFLVIVENVTYKLSHKME